MLSIQQRPFSPDGCTEAGHWEGDLIIGKDRRSVIGTLVERQTRLVRLLLFANVMGRPCTMGCERGLPFPPTTAAGCYERHPKRTVDGTCGASLQALRDPESRWRKAAICARVTGSLGSYRPVLPTPSVMPSALSHLTASS